MTSMCVLLGIQQAACWEVLFDRYAEFRTPCVPGAGGLGRESFPAKCWTKLGVRCPKRNANARKRSWSYEMMVLY